MDDATEPLEQDEEYHRVRNRHVRRAALDGAALGLLAGFLGGAYTDTHVPYLVTTSVIGIVACAAIAALIASRRRY
jgi:hypothetical protein